MWLSLIVYEMALKTAAAHRFNWKREKKMF